MVVIARSARRHGVTDDDMLHALRNAMRQFDHDEGVTILLGPDRASRLLEVGIVRVSDATIIIHAMTARARFLG